jgi:hypothetical protein
VSGLKLLNQELYVGGDDFLFGGGLLADGGDVVYVGCAAHGVISFCIRTSALKRGIYMPNATWRRRG